MMVAIEISGPQRASQVAVYVTVLTGSVVVLIMSCRLRGGVVLMSRDKLPEKDEMQRLPLDSEVDLSTTACYYCLGHWEAASWYA